MTTTSRKALMLTGVGVAAAGSSLSAAGLVFHAPAVGALGHLIDVTGFGGALILYLRARRQARDSQR